MKGKRRPGAPVVSSLRRATSQKMPASPARSAKLGWEWWLAAGMLIVGVPLLMVVADILRILVGGHSLFVLTFFRDHIAPLLPVVE